MSEELPRFEQSPGYGESVPLANYAYLEYLLEVAEEKIEWLERDELTGLKVDKIIRNELDSRVEKASQTGGEFVLIIGDVDNMKAANTEFGHYLGGDALLKAVGRSCREGDLIGRAGGDELWWIADLKPRKEYHPHRPLHVRRDSLENVAAKLAAVFEKRANSEIKKLGLDVPVGFSAGFALYRPEASSGTMIDRASKAMLARKTENKEKRLSMDRHPANYRTDQE